MINLTGLWLHTGRGEIRADFSNDRHHAVRINGGDVVEALLTLAHQIGSDPHLKESDNLKTGYARLTRPDLMRTVHAGPDCPMARRGPPLQLVDVSTLGNWRRCRYCFG